jgi:hypothetical protein
VLAFSPPLHPLAWVRLHPPRTNFLPGAASINHPPAPQLQFIFAVARTASAFVSSGSSQGQPILFKRNIQSAPLPFTQPIYFPFSFVHLIILTIGRW